jgi:DNA-binding MarR family transcriptional regulator
MRGKKIPDEIIWRAWTLEQRTGSRREAAAWAGCHPETLRRLYQKAGIARPPGGRRKGFEDTALLIMLDEPLSAGDLADDQDTTRSYARKILVGLEDRGYCQRTRRAPVGKPRAHQTLYYTLTPEGLHAALKL